MFVFNYKPNIFMKILDRDIAERCHHEHYKKLDEIRSVGCGWPSQRVPDVWAERVGAIAPTGKKWPSVKHDRDTLKRFCESPDNSPETCFVSIMAWGGMKYPHGRKIWQHQDKWVDIIAQIRSGNLSRTEAYAAFATFRADNPGCGMGPAYFTKLIFFCHPDHDGYIMDQWTSLSVNLLYGNAGQPVIDLATSVFRGVRTDTVSDRNSPETYETFCLCVEDLARRLGDAPEIVEEWLFSKGGRFPSPWRKHVKENRLPICR